MKTLIALSLLFSMSAQAKIILEKNTFYVEGKGKKVPISMLNNLAKTNAITKVTLFANGNIHMVAFAKKNEKEKNYTVSEDGYMYSLKPFTDYEVKRINGKGLVEFKQDPKRSYKIDSKGIFLY